MILHVYMVLLVFAIALLITGIYLGSRRSHTNILNNGNPVAETIVKKGAIVSILLMATMLFGVLAYSSMNIETTECIEPTTNITTIDTNTTQETVSCDPYIYRNDTLAYFMSLLAFVSVIFSLIYML